MNTKYLFLLLTLVFFSINTFAQEPEWKQKLKGSIYKPLVTQPAIFNKQIIKKVDVVSIKNESLLNAEGIIKVKRNTNAIVQVEGYNRNLYTIKIGKVTYSYDYTEDNGIQLNGNLLNDKKNTKHISSLDGEEKTTIERDAPPQETLKKLSEYNFELLKTRYKSANLTPSIDKFTYEIKACDKILEEAFNTFNTQYNLLITSSQINSKQRENVKQQNKSLKELIQYRNQLNTNPNDVFVANYPIIFDDGDEVDIEISVLKKGSNTPVHKVKYKTLIHGDFKINFHAGLAFDFFNANKSYSYMSLPDNNKAILEDELPLNVTPNIAIFANGYKKSKNNVNWGISLGIGGSVDKGLSYYSGISCLIGRNDRLVITTGPSVAQRDHLRSIYQVGDIFDGNNAPEIKELVEKKYSAGWFISIGFNLNSLTKNN